MYSCIAYPHPHPNPNPHTYIFSFNFSGGYMYIWNSCHNFDGLAGHAGFIF